MSHMIIRSCYTLTVISHGVVKKGFCDIVRYISLKELFFFTEVVDPPAALDYSPENIKLIRFPDYLTEQKLPVRQINRQVKITVMKYCLFHYCTIFLTDLVIVRDYIIDESVRKKYPCSQPCMIKQPCVIETSGTYCLSEARKVALELAKEYKMQTLIDTILCLDGTEVVGACMASELTRAGFMNMNAHRTIYVVTPEHTSGSQLLFRDNSAPMIVGKHVLVLAASVTTGYTAQAAIEAIRYYNGIPVGICAIFTCVDECEGFPIASIFNTKNVLSDYESTTSHDCPLCKAGFKLDALVNAHGISSF